MKKQLWKKRPNGSAIESVTVTDKSIEVMFKNVRLIFDGITEVIESEYEKRVSHNFKAGLEIPESKELTDLIKKIRDKFSDMKFKNTNGTFVGSIAVEHFNEKKFGASSNAGHVLLYPSAPAEEQEDGSFQAKGKLYVNPSPDVFYQGCWVSCKVAFVANNRGGITIKDYLNGIKFEADGEPIAGAQDPWKDSQSKATVKGKRKPESKPEETKKNSKKKR